MQELFRPLHALGAPGTHIAPTEMACFPPWLQVASVLEELSDSPTGAASGAQGLVGRLTRRSLGFIPRFSTTYSDTDSDEAAPSVRRMSRRECDEDLRRYRHMHDSLFGDIRKMVVYCSPYS
ncbi:hypothetical protein J3F83DRAFT_751258 [Trichoderma novae-zelandiae]